MMKPANKQYSFEQIKDGVTDGTVTGHGATEREARSRAAKRLPQGKAYAVGRLIKIEPYNPKPEE
jgi:hypothetical protein